MGDGTGRGALNRVCELPGGGGFMTALQMGTVTSMGFSDSSAVNLPAMQETPVQFLGWENPLEKG